MGRDVNQEILFGFLFFCINVLAGVLDWCWKDCDRSKHIRSNDCVSLYSLRILIIPTVESINRSLCADRYSFCIQRSIIVFMPKSLLWTRKLLRFKCISDFPLISNQIKTK